MNTDYIKKEMIALITLRGLPVGFARAEADSGYIIHVDVDGKVMGLDYAEDASGLSITELSLVDLAHLLEHGVRGRELEKLLQY